MAVTAPSPDADAPPPIPAETKRRLLRIKGRRKAAVLLVALGPERSAEVFKHLRDDEIETLSLEMAKILKVTAETSEAIFDEAADHVVAADSIAEGGVEFARDVLERSVGPERAAEIIGRLSTVIERRPFEFLRRTPPEQIVAFLRSEAPQVQALVIANLHTTLAAQVLGNFDEAEQSEIALRVAQMGETSPDVIRDIESVMRQKLSNVASEGFAAAGGVKSLAEILNHTDRPTERNVLESLVELDAELGEEVRRLLFVFEDIVRLDDRSIQMVLKDVDQKDLALALRGVADEVRERLLSNMSARGSEMLKEEMEFQPPQKRRVVEEAQGRVVGVVRRLEEAGAIVLARGGGDEDDEVV
jgi:flagellar motor switch protein FliG